MGQNTPPPGAKQDGHEEPNLKGFDDFEVLLGDTMRGERATLGKSLLDVQRDLKIKASYIAAIENCDPTAFETQGFVAGYVRSYARYLGMDPDWTFEAFCRESGFSAKPGAQGGSSSKSAGTDTPNVRHAPVADDPFSRPSPIFQDTNRGFWGQVEPRAIVSVLVLAAMVGGLGYGAWTVLQEVQKVRVTPVAQAPGLVATVDPLIPSVDSIASSDELTVSETDTSEALDRLYLPQALDTPVLVARDGPISAVDPSTVGALAGLVPAPPVLDTAPVTPQSGTLVAEAASADDESAVRTVEEVPPEVVLFAVRPAWVRVQAADGTVLFEKILDSGERYTVPQNEVPPQLRAGNSGCVYFEVAGEFYGPAGPGTTVAKNVVLGVDAVRDTFEAVKDPENRPVRVLAELTELIENGCG